ncbi:cell envelope integrity protein TolA [Microvirga arabica]|uniref:cell envelope integrity protein TolA n=2 Tax=Microvirga arabica TaxID=1128671 RepID=UPI0019398ADB|nr:TonB family protein [Microvirga arabica]MBM1169469.1 energy transducer TonB [Microvirga arabica]
MFAQSIRSTQEPSRLGIAFITALALHGAALGALTFWRSSVDNTPGEQEITVDLAPAMEEAVSVAPAEMAAVAAPPVEPEPVPLQPETIEPLSPEEVTAEQPVEVAELPEPQDTTEVPPAEAEMAVEPEPVVAIPPPEVVVAKPAEQPPPPKPEKKPPPPKPVERKPPARRTVAQQQQQPSEARQGQASSSRENMGGAAASADPTALNRYRATLYAAVKSRLRYPSSAESRGIVGTAEIRFTLDRSGQVLSVSLVRSTGNPLLDQAALATARPGSSLPSPPDSVPQQLFTITAPLRFSPR